MMDVVSFRCDAHLGHGEVQGIARLEDDGLQLQYQTHDAVLGVLRPDTYHARIPVETIVGCRYHAGFLWLRPWLELRVADMAPVANIPSRDGGRLSLRIRFGERHAGRAMITGIDARRAEFRLSRFENELDRMTGQRPPMTPAPTGTASRPGGSAASRDSEGQ